MKTIFERPAYAITPNEYLEGRTLCAVYKIEPEDKTNAPVYFDADYKLCFMIMERPEPIYLSNEDFVSLMNDDLQRITINAALAAHKRTAAAYVKDLAPADQKRIAAYETAIEDVIGVNAWLVKEELGGKGK